MPCLGCACAHDLISEASHSPFSHLSAFLCLMPAGGSLVTLGMSNNNIGSEGAAALAQALHFNYTLRTLLLRYACVMTVQR